MEQTVLAKTKKIEVAVDAAGTMYVNGKPASISDAVKAYTEAEASGGALLGFPTAAKVQTIEQAAEAQRTEIDAKIATVQAEIEAANQKYYRERDEWNRERIRIEALEREVQTFKRRHPPMSNVFNEEKNLERLQVERSKISESLSEASELRSQQRLSADELAQISNEAALLNRIRKVV